MLVSIDFETYLISNEAPWPRPVCLSYYDGETLDLVIADDMEKKLREFLESDKFIIAHNMAFEFNVIYEHFPDLRELLLKKAKEDKLVCTLIYQQLINHTAKKALFKFSLADLVDHYFDIDIFAGKTEPDAWRLRYSELDGVPLHEWPYKAVEYALSDSEWAYKVFLEQRGKRLKYGESVRSEALLNLMGKFGIMVDKDRVATLEREIYGHLEPSYQRLTEMGFCEYKKPKANQEVTSKKPSKKMKKLREYIEENVKDIEYTAKGVVATTGEALKMYHKETDDIVFEDFMNVSDYEKVITAFVNNLKQADPVIRTRYSATKSTGRTSSSIDRTMPSVNIQQMPREVKDVTWDVRNCFIPRAGYKIVSIDYSGLELSSTGHQLYKVYGRSAMRDMINKGDKPTDMHSMFAYRLRNMDKKYPTCTYEEFVANKKKETFKEYRQLAKPINLGFPGGIGYDTMRKLLLKEGIKTKFKIITTAKTEDYLLRLKRKLYDCNEMLRVARLNKYQYALVVDELVILKNELFNLYPELGWFLREDNTRYLTGETKRMMNDYGEWEDEEMYKYDIYGMKRDWCTYTAFCNGFLMQTPAAIGAKRMMCEIIEKYRDDTRMNPLAFIHDEIVFEVLDTDDKYDIIKDVSTIMIDQMQTVLDTVRIAVEAEIMDYWMKAGGEWSKTYWKNPNEDELHEK